MFKLIVLTFAAILAVATAGYVAPTALNAYGYTGYSAPYAYSAGYATPYAYSAGYAAPYAYSAYNGYYGGAYTPYSYHY